MADIRGIDVSRFNGEINWKKVASDGVKVAILRVTAGSDDLAAKDLRFDSYYAGCVNTGIKIGVYRYSYAKTVDQIKKEAEGVVKALKGKTIQYPVFLDLEWDWQRNNLSKTKFSEFIEAFRKVVEDAGHTFGIYTNMDWMRNVLPASVQKYPLWIARYPSADKGEIREDLRVSASDYQTCIGWQYSSKGKVSGISGNVDLDIFYKDYGTNKENEKMTETQLRQRVVDMAKKDSGAKQYGAKHEQIIKDFNKIPGMGNWMTTKYAWCAATVSVWGYRAGLGGIYYPSASCNAMINMYKSHGRWVENDAYVPKPGDLIMYNWEAAATGDDKGEADHVGLVVSVANGFMTIIEGNKANAVGTRTVEVNWRYIRGFCIPDFASMATKNESKVKKDWAKALQTALNVSYELNLKVDGKVMAKTKQAIDHNYLWYVRQRPMRNAHVSWLQAALNELGYDIDVDGSFGPQCDRILKEFQRDQGIDVDGYAGVQTHLTILKALQK